MNNQVINEKNQNILTFRWKQIEENTIKDIIPKEVTRIKVIKGCDIDLL